MKPLYLAAMLSVAIASPSMAQIQLEDNHFPVIGSGFEMQFSDPNPKDFGLADSDANAWDLRTLKLSVITNHQGYVAASKTKYSSEFGQATLAAGSAAGATNGIYQYYASTQKQLEYHGYVSSVFSLDTTYTYPIVFDKPISTLKFPLTYKDTFHTSSTYSSITKRIFGEEGETDSVFGKISRIVQADAYGTLLMPDQSVHQVLRLHIQESKYDSVVSDTGHRISAYDNSWYEFHSLEYALPVVTVYMNNDQVSSIALLDRSKSTKIVGINPYLLSDTRLYPNPASNVLLIENEHASNIEIFSIDGTLTTTVPVNNKAQVDISFLPTGLFLVVLKNSENQVCGRSQLVKMSH